MALVGSSCLTAPGQSALGQEGTGEGPIVVWLWGEHDISTDGALSLVLARAIAIESGGACPGHERGGVHRRFDAGDNRPRPASSSGSGRRG